MTTATLRGVLLGLALYCLGGCASPAGSDARFSRSDAIHELHLFVLPVALKSGQPGTPDGFAVRVFASSRNRAKGVPIRNGSLEILAYDGLPAVAGAAAVKPAQVWSYPAASLPAVAIFSSLGAGYELALPWQGPRPVQSRLAIVARFMPPTGPVIQSATSVIPLVAP